MVARRLWRLLNLTIVQAARLRGRSLPALVCECRSWSCARTVRVPLSTYSKLRQRHECVVLHGHQQPAVERVVWGSEDFLVTDERPRAA